MSEKDIEREIQARVEFKMNELLTGVKNRVRFLYCQAFDMTKESEYAWDAFAQLEEMFKKELHMGTPSNQMDLERRWKAKEKAVDNIMECLDLRGRDSTYDAKVRKVVSEIEKAQNY